MTLDESRNCEPALEIDDLSAVADEPADLRVRADREDGGSTHGYRFRFGAGRIDCDDSTVPQDERCGFARRRARGATGSDGGGGDGSSEEKAAMNRGRHV